MNKINGRPSFDVAAICVLLLGILMSVVGAAASSSPRAAAILADAKDRGSKAAVATLWADNVRWSSVMANIGHGKPEWLEVAAALQPGTDGGAAETLDEAVFFALKPSPVAVLNLLGEHHFQVELVCSSNIGTDYTPDRSRRYIRERIKILEGLSDSKLLAIRDECLTGLRAALKDFPVTKKPSQ